MGLVEFASFAGAAILVIVALWFIVCLLFSISSKLDEVANSMASILAEIGENARQKNGRG